MKKAMILCAAWSLYSAIAGAQGASSCGTPTLHDFTVYSAGNVDVQQSDYQGMAGAAGMVHARNFQFNATRPGCFGLMVGGKAVLESLEINGDTEAKGGLVVTESGLKGRVFADSARVQGSSISGGLSTLTPAIVKRSSVGSFHRGRVVFLAPHEALIQEMRVESDVLSQLTPNLSAKGLAESGVLSLGPGRNVLRLTNPEALSSLRLLVLRGEVDSELVVNIPGTSAVLDRQDIEIEGTLSPAKIVWNFYQADQLTLTHTGNSRLGMPGEVLAPKATVVFNEALITGSLYAGAIITEESLVSYLNSGQVNLPGAQPPAIMPPPPSPE